MFSGKAEPPPVKSDDVLPANLRDSLNRSSRAFRVYQTAAGWRLILCDSAIAAVDNSSLETMRQFPVDPQYLKLCERQKSCRARLTPKSLRVGLNRPRYRYPYEAGRVEAAMFNWSADYLKAIDGHRTCRLLEGGDLEIAPELLSMIELHDQLSGIDTDAPLA